MSIFSPLTGPLRYPVFRALWIATIVSNLGTLMHGVGAAWLMTSMTTSAFLVGLVPAAVFLPTFLVGLWGGVLADVFDRRIVLLCTQTAMLVAALAMGILTLEGVMSPGLLIALAFCLGLASSLNLPAWQSQIPDIVPQSEVAAAVSLNSMSFNTARSVGPALGGVLVGFAGPAIVFLLNAASYLGTIGVLVAWKRKPARPAVPSGFAKAMAAGWVYAMSAPELRAPLIRVSVFAFGTSCVWAVLPLLARHELGMGAGGYGSLLSAFGLGSLLMGSLVPGLRRLLHPDRIIAAAVLVLSAVLCCLAFVRIDGVLYLALFLGGGAWVGAMVQFNVAIQTTVPAGLRGRAMAFYIVCFQGGLGLGSAFNGWLAGQLGIPHALVISGLVVLSGLFLGAIFPMMSESSVHTPADFEERA